MRRTHGPHRLEPAIADLILLARRRHPDGAPEAACIRGTLALMESTTAESKVRWLGRK